MQEALRSRGYSCTVQWIDLRWGLDQRKTPESERELQILQVCLEEIERSKPLFLCLLGHAYGTEASPAAIASLTKEFDIELHDGAHSITVAEIEFALALAARKQVTPLFLLREGATRPSRAWLLKRLRSRRALLNASAATHIGISTTTAEHGRRA